MASPIKSALASRNRCQRWLKSTPGRRLPGLPLSRYRLMRVEPLQEDDRDLAGRFLAVVVEAGIDARMVLVEALVVLVARDVGACLELLAQDLQGDIR